MKSLVLDSLMNSFQIEAWGSTFSCWPAFIQPPTFTLHNPEKNVQTCITEMHKNTCTHTPPLFPALALCWLQRFKREFQAVWQIDQQLSLHVWELRCPIGFGRFLRPQRYPGSQQVRLPTAITRPVSALHSSLICYRHTSEGTAHAGFLCVCIHV